MWNLRSPTPAYRIFSMLRPFSLLWFPQYTRAVFFHYIQQKMSKFLKTLLLWGGNYNATVRRAKSSTVDRAFRRIHTCIHSCALIHNTIADKLWLNAARWFNWTPSIETINSLSTSELFVFKPISSLVAHSTVKTYERRFLNVCIQSNAYSTLYAYPHTIKFLRTYFSVYYPALFWTSMFFCHLSTETVCWFHAYAWEHHFWLF